MKPHYLLPLVLSLLLFCGMNHLSARERRLFDRDWLFSRSDSAEMAQTAYDDSGWRKLNLPHDWSIEGDFHVSHPSGSVGGALPGGTGWYRKHFKLNDTDEQSRYFIDFDGVYMNSTVYLNGHRIGFRPYGYIGFQYDLTPYIRKNGDNVIAVRVDNSTQPNCRWYSGSGIYRHVYLLRTPQQLYINHWGVYVRSHADGDRYAVKINVKLTNAEKKAKKVVVRNTILDREGRLVAGTSSTVRIHETAETEQTLRIRNPHLWSVASPYTYRVKTEILAGGKVIDTQITRTGIRSVEFSPTEGFSLNGVRMKINGVCLHHDLGCLGSALHEDALYRQLKMLKDMGCNAIRTAHNPPAPELLHMCDTMGLMVMDEAFDAWLQGKTRNDYASLFDEWAERDLTDMVLRDRNHPSIIMWSIGNEVHEQWNTRKNDTVSLAQVNILLNMPRDASALSDKDADRNVYALLTRRLADIVRKADDTRPITAGCNETSPKNNLFQSGALDIIGFNYHHRWIKDVPKNFPGKPFLMTESVSALQTRGFYMMPSDSVYTAPHRFKRPYVNPTFMCSSYDNMHTSWSSTHEATWDVVKHTPYCSGQFIWTGWDYIGEPTPYAFPARSSYFGIIDLAGFPKDIYYMYQSEWTDKTVLHLFPHWNWLEGSTVDLWCYYNHADEVELFVNGKSQGIRAKKDSHQYHVAWRVPFEAGEVCVVARKGNQEVGRKTIRTAGPPHHIRLTSDQSTLKADGKSLAFVAVEVVDKDGNLCPMADHQIHFTLDGEACIAGVDNGSQFSMERFQANHRKAFHGRCLVVLRSTDQTGKITLTARAVGLQTATLSLNE